MIDTVLEYRKLSAQTARRHLLNVLNPKACRASDDHRDVCVELCERSSRSSLSARSGGPGDPLGPITAATRQRHGGGLQGVMGRVRRYVLQTQLNTTDAIRLYRSHRGGICG